MRVGRGTYEDGALRSKEDRVWVSNHPDVVSIAQLVAITILQQRKSARRAATHPRNSFWWPVHMGCSRDRLLHETCSGPKVPETCHRVNGCAPRPTPPSCPSKDPVAFSQKFYRSLCVRPIPATPDPRLCWKLAIVARVLRKLWTIIAEAQSKVHRSASTDLARTFASDTGRRKEPRHFLRELNTCIRSRRRCSAISPFRTSEAFYTVISLTLSSTRCF